MVPELPGCPENFILQAIKKTVRKFCQDTDAWREQLASIDLVEGQLPYVLTPTWEAEIKHIIEVRINTEDGIAESNIGALIDPKLYTFYGEASTRLGVAIVKNTLYLDESLEPAEDVTDGLEVKISLVPELNTDDKEIDMNFLVRWSEAIIGGSIWWLMTLKGRKWSDPQRAPLFLLDYNRGLSRARRETAGGQKVEVEDLSA
jgi:hypothetical protein